MIEGKVFLVGWSKRIWVSLMVNESSIVDKLNKEGVFLQKYCSKKIHEASWNVEEEFPVSVRFPTEKADKIYESTGDIRARRKLRDIDCDLVALVECKHRFEARWIFFKPAISFSRTLNLLDLQYLVEANAPKNGTGFYYYAEIDPKKMKNCLICNIGKETPDTTAHGKKEYESIYLACREVALATKSSAEEFRNDFDTYGVSLPYVAPTHTILIPIIVTSASLEFCDYSLEDFEKEKVVKNPSFNHADWLAYDFPLSSDLRLAYRMQHDVDYREMDRQTIFIVNFTKCSQFFQLLESYFKEWNKESLHEIF
jgi:hypothetical protein